MATGWPRPLGQLTTPTRDPTPWKKLSTTFTKASLNLSRGWSPPSRLGLPRQRQRPLFLHSPLLRDLLADCLPLSSARRTELIRLACLDQSSCRSPEETQFRWELDELEEVHLRPKLEQTVLVTPSTHTRAHLKRPREPYLTWKDLDRAQPLRLVCLLPLRLDLPLPLLVADRVVDLLRRTGELLTSVPQEEKLRLRLIKADRYPGALRPEVHHAGVVLDLGTLVVESVIAAGPALEVAPALGALVVKTILLAVVPVGLALVALLVLAAEVVLGHVGLVPGVRDVPLRLPFPLSCPEES